jgi:hypothetical protein
VENGFVAMENCFVGTRMTKQFQIKINDFKQLKISSIEMGLAIQPTVRIAEPEPSPG